MAKKKNPKGMHEINVQTGILEHLEGISMYLEEKQFEKHSNAMSD